MLHNRVTSLGAAVASLLLTLTALVTLPASPAQADSRQFPSATQYPGTAGPGRGVAVSADFNGDGYPDLAVADYVAGAVRVLLNQGNGTFAVAGLYPTGLGAGSVTAADFTNDGHVDLAVANTLDSTMVVLINRGDGTFERGATYPTGLQPAQILSADFNGDGWPDLAIASTVPAGNIVVLLNQGGGRFTRSQTLTVGISVLFMQTADVNGDHRPDLLVGDALRGVTVLTGRGNGTFTTGATVPLPIIEGFAVGDVNHDGIVDLAIPGFIRDTVSVFLGRGDGTFAPPIVSGVNPHPGVVPTFPISAVMADLNGDGTADLAVSGGPDNTLYIMVGDGTGRFTTTESHALQNMPRTIIADDLNRDRRLDLVVTELLSRTAILLHS